MPIANEYEALTPEACTILDDFVKLFKEYIRDKSYGNFTIREHQYLAHQGIDAAAAEIVLRKAMAKRKRERGI
jgi:heme oxygenase